MWEGSISTDNMAVALLEGVWIIVYIYQKMERYAKQIGSAALIDG